MMGAAENLPALLLDITPDKAPAVYQGKGLDSFFEHIKESVNEVPDVSTAKGRARIASLSGLVSRSKTAVEKPGRDYLKQIKELPKQIEAELRDFSQKCDALRDEVRRPLTEWEEEQERIKAEAEAAEAAEALAHQIESDHEIAILLNREYDRQLADRRQAEEQAKIKHEAEIARAAAEKAKQEAEAKARAEHEAALRREVEAKAAAERAERERADAEARAAQAKKDAAAQAERAKADAIAQERRLVEAERQRAADEEAARAADVEYKKRINNEALVDLAEATGLTADAAKLVISSIARGHIRHINITY